MFVLTSASVSVPTSLPTPDTRPIFRYSLQKDFCLGFGCGLELDLGFRF